MGYNNQSNILGQGGTAYITTASALYTAPTGKVIAAIQMIEGAAFTTLNAVNDTGSNTYQFGVADPTADSSASTPIIGHGTGAVTLGAEVIPTGVTIYGRWSKCRLDTGGKAIVYLDVI
jgi:hypothetical protein